MVKMRIVAALLASVAFMAACSSPSNPADDARREWVEAHPGMVDSCDWDHDAQLAWCDLPDGGVVDFIWTDDVNGVVSNEEGTGREVWVDGQLVVSSTSVDVIASVKEVLG